MLLLLALGVLVLSRHPPTERTFVARLGAPVLASVAIGLAVAFSSAVTYAVAEYLDRGSSPTPARPLPPGAPPLSPPVAYRWAALGFSVALVVVWGVAVIGARTRQARYRRQAEELVHREFPEASRVPRERVEAVRDAVVKARLADRLGPLLPIAYAVLALLTLGAAGLSLVHQGPGALALRLGGQTLARPVIFVTDLGGALTGVFALVLAVAGLFAYRSAGVRSVGVLWDLATFWPRGAHPLAPPCYAERAVPELTRRIGQLVAGCDQVVLSGQSHGSVLALAAVLQLPATCQRRVALLTYASPLGTLYRRFFPGYVNDSVLYEAGERIDWRWINLWRYTDPIGGWIFAGDPVARPGHPTARVGGRATEVDRRVRDPAGLTVAPTDTVPPPVRKHHFTSDQDLHSAVSELTRRLEAGEPPGVRG
ncbi:hypothetical protein [Micromonospora sp. WMMD736]|uniref:hypothetical protein n=1 Tax=Micromonospora sp. WMMD736 TaxID=3404112 RepID=UPI003B9652A1